MDGRLNESKNYSAEEREYDFSTDLVLKFIPIVGQN